MPALRYILLILIFAMPGALPLSAQSNEAIWQSLEEGGLVILMRHALAPGIGDPPGFERGRCETQRNLSHQGRAQARALGEVFRERDIPIGAVYASRWCRALDTAVLMQLGDVEPAPWLDSFFRERSARAARTRAAREQIAAWEKSGNMLLVTHQVNISALVGRSVGSGEMVVVRPATEGLEVLGRLDVRAP
ncbi:broad specificity phosphatase PhoE [Chromohalobacter marismortui]|uniref:Broad specificity phosphatase PhoE n=1 Tax=Chromohalobacter marismortui TaxID=42055 RepID=A0A4R7NRP5_9GAMM|nr:MULTISPECIES: histidine phosphatase family protein [Chromohalobacter]MCI0592370.1 histidine phosphatase family protein [Chromohalobacter sp.]TDU23547.1 broad specificity phosphatase PhoE [Chromohalobacter marismortui]